MKTCTLFPLLAMLALSGCNYDLTREASGNGGGSSVAPVATTESSPETVEATGSTGARLTILCDPAAKSCVHSDKFSAGIGSIKGLFDPLSVDQHAHISSFQIAKSVTLDVDVADFFKFEMHKILDRVIFP